MKNKFSVIIAFLTILIISLTGCSKYEKDESYPTDAYGTYINQIGEENSKYFSKWTYIINSDNTFQYIYKETVNTETTDEINNNGKILSIEEISNDITKITLENDNILYKYKNMLGGLYETEIPSSRKFDLIIPTPTDNWTGSYPNAANVFDKNGAYHSCLDITNCNDTEEDHIGIYYKYIRKNNLIYFIDPSVENMNYQILYYIVDDGLFFPESYKTE